ncbi:unnamed protein product [Leptidea sinapis]|uniref:unspecific monooxygenase n=1 Tax=Leptidea sinapis TaxID=189913 RepID=A0A5E4QE10_9NEOP|nr:unnamed protein product [Leptidea sinapis]
MFWILINCFAISVCFWVLYKWTRVKRYWAEKGVPHLTPHPIMGSLNFLQRENPDPLWSWIRRRLAPIFTASKLRALQNLFDTKSKELIQRINNEKDKTKINLKIVFTDFTTDIIGIASFGIASDSTLTGESPMRTVTHGFMKFDLYRGLCWSNIEVSEDVIVAQAAVFVLGGFDTSGNTLTMAIYELAHHPQIQDKLYKEIKQEVDDGTGILNVTKLAEATYLNCVIKETLRKFSPMGWLDRVAMNDYRVDENLIISAGTPVYINAIGMQYDPELFPEPERFIPERFLPENKMDIKSFTYLPFGQRFGLMTLRHAISRIILNYKLEPVPGSPLPNEIEIEKRGLFLFPGEPTEIMFWILVNCIAVSVCLWLYVKWKKVKQYWAERGVAHLEPHPIMGSLTFLQKENPILLIDYTTDIIGMSAFGIDSNATLTGEGPIRKITNSFMTFNLFSLFPNSTAEYFRKIFEKIKSQRKQHKDDDSKDLLGALLKMQEDAEHTDEKIQNKLYEELKGFGKEDLEVTKLAEAVYLNCVIKELLRKVPPMGWIDRVALSDYKVDDNLVIPAGTPVYINANGMHYDRDYFPDPESFNPDRFLPENEIKQFTYLPFVSMRHALTKLVLNFTFKALPGTPKPSEIEFEKRGLFLNPAEHLYVDFIPRDIKT